MPPYFIKKPLLRAIMALPAPRAFDRLVRLCHYARAGENVGDMTINGELRFLREVGPGSAVLVDGGANRGEWTRHALAIAPAAQIHAFEPVASSFERLEANGFPPRVTCNRCGLSDEPGEREIDAATGSLYPRGVNGGPVERVRLTTLDAYCFQRDIDGIDLLKLDVEGHELAALRGARQLLAGGRIARVQFEYGPSNIYSRVLLRDLFTFLAPFGFDFFHITPHAVVSLDGYDPRLENFQYKNFVAVRTGLEPGRE